MTTFVTRGPSAPTLRRISSTSFVSRGRSFLIPPGPTLDQPPVRFERHSPNVIRGVVNARNWTEEVRHGD